MIDLHLPNRLLDYNEFESEILPLNCKSFVDLDLFKNRWPYISRYGAIHARIYTEKGKLPDPVYVIDSISNLIKTYGPYVKTWRFGNEPNVEYDCTSGEWYVFLLRFARLWHKYFTAQLYLTAIGGEGSRDREAFIEASACAEMYYDGADGHIYGTPSTVEAQLKYMRTRYDTGKPLLITEYNFGAGSVYDVDRWAEDVWGVDKLSSIYNVRICVFSWDWHRPDIGCPTPVSIRGTSVAQAIRRINTVPSFNFGFKDLANKLGTDVVGEPLMDERSFNGFGDTEQFTSKGRMVWTKSLNLCQFYPCTLPKPISQSGLATFPTKLPIPSGN